MTKLIGLTTLLAFLLSVNTSFAQKTKFGYIDAQSLLTLMPEATAAQKTLEAESKKIEDRLVAMQTEFQKKYTEYGENVSLNPKSAEKWSDLERTDKETELQSLQARIEKYQQSAQQSLTTKQNEIFKPILEKVQQAIKDVGKEGKFTDIKDVNTLLYHSDSYIDVTPLVKVKLGIK